MVFYRTLTSPSYKQVYRFFSNGARQSLLYGKFIGYKNTNKLEYDQKILTRDLSIKTRIRQRLLRYSRTTIALYITISIISFQISYRLVAKRVDVQEFFTSIGFDRKTIQKMPEELGTLLIAYGCHTLLAPLRVTLTLLLTPITIRYLKKLRIIKTNRVTNKAK